MEMPGIDPGTSRMLSGRSTIWATPPWKLNPFHTDSKRIIDHMYNLLTRLHRGFWENLSDKISYQFSFWDESRIGHAFDFWPVFWSMKLPFLDSSRDAVQ